jgi:hypothetical protein
LLYELLSLCSKRVARAVSDGFRQEVREEEEGSCQQKDRGSDIRDCSVSIHFDDENVTDASATRRGGVVEYEMISFEKKKMVTCLFQVLLANSK